MGEVRYKAWGEERYTAGTTPTTYRYTGQRAEVGIGLYFYNARWYDPALSRFISPDTIVPDSSDPQSLNRYSYVLNAPSRYVDPLGHQDLSEDVIKDWGYAEDITEILLAMFKSAQEGNRLWCALMEIHQANLSQAPLKIIWARGMEENKPASYNPETRTISLNQDRKDSGGDCTELWAGFIVHEVTHMTLYDKGMRGSLQQEYYATLAGTQASIEMGWSAVPGAGCGVLNMDLAQWVTDPDVQEAWGTPPAYGREGWTYAMGAVLASKVDLLWIRTRR